jgi:hypothetical protein
VGGGTEKVGVVKSGRLVKGSTVVGVGHKGRKIKCITVKLEGGSK